VENEKTIVFCALPGVQILIYALFTQAGISTTLFSGSLAPAEKRAAVDDLNYDLNKGTIFVASYLVGSAGLNLQFGFRRVVLFDSPINQSQQDQAVCRCRRHGQEATFIAKELWWSGTFQDRLIASRLSKATPAILLIILSAYEVV
jgi:SNF2 family DNA or RNA helicase